MTQMYKIATAMVALVVANVAFAQRVNVTGDTVGLPQHEDREIVKVVPFKPWVSGHGSLDVSLQCRGTISNNVAISFFENLSTNAPAGEPSMKDEDAALLLEWDRGGWAVWGDRLRRKWTAGDSSPNTDLKSLNFKLDLGSRGEVKSFVSSHTFMQEGTGGAFKDWPSVANWSSLKVVVRGLDAQESDLSVTYDARKKSLVILFR